MQMMYIYFMRYEWNPNKNALLKQERKISFEKIIFHLSQGNIWKIADHPDQRTYPRQKIYFVIVDGYIYLVPYVEGKNHIFLKTIIPSRKATKVYGEERKNDQTR